MQANVSRRALIKSAASTALVAGVAMPAILKAQTDAITHRAFDPADRLSGSAG